MRFSYPNRVYWCDYCNVPLLSNSHCPVCGRETVDAKVGRGEIKPIFDKEKEWYKELLIKENHDPGILPDSMCFYYRGSVIVDGHKIFRTTYDEERSQWGIHFYKKYEDFDGELLGTDLDLTVEANSLFLEQIEMDSLEQITRVYNEYPSLPHANSFSGGKDSAVTLKLVRYLDKDIPTIYMNTTIDFPETVEYVRDLAKAWGLNLIELEPSRDFFSLCDELGPPSRFMRWCCKTSKFGPIGRYFRITYDSDVLVASGIRANESKTRAEYDPVQKNSAIPNQLLHFPILKWNSLMVWLYHYWRNIPINPAYDYGYSRLGCMFCPEKTSRDLNRLQRTHGELYSKYTSQLTKFGKSNDIDKIDNWIQTNSWRFRASKYNKKHLNTYSLCQTSNSKLIKIQKNKIESVKEFLKVYGDSENIGKLHIIKNHALNLSVINDTMRITYYTDDKKIHRKFKLQLERAINCIGCGSCLNSCPNGAMKIENNKLHITDDCIHCMKCLETNGLRKGCIALNYKKTQLLYS